MGLVEVDLTRCIRCAACAILAPAVFEVSRKGTRVRRQPETADEQRACRAAAAICPTRALGAL